MTSPDPRLILDQSIERLQLPAVTVPLDTPVRELPSQLAAHRGCNTISVVDGSGTLAGIIPVSLIVQDLLFEVMPGELLADLLEPGRAEELARGVHARTAGELMRPPLSVSAGSSVRDAVHALHRAELLGLPVIDGQSRVTGYVDLMEILLAWWDAEQAGDATDSGASSH